MLSNFPYSNISIQTIPSFKIKQFSPFILLSMKIEDIIMSIHEHFFTHFHIFRLHIIVQHNVTQIIENTYTAFFTDYFK